MQDTNVLLLMGRLVRDPEMKYTSENLAIAKFSIANNKGERNGEDQGASFFSCTCFGIVAENLQRYCQKGRQVIIEGAIDQNRWIDRQGQKRSMVKVIAYKVRYLGNGRRDDGDAVTAPVPEPQPPTEPVGEPEPTPPAEDDDIPF